MTYETILTGTGEHQSIGANILPFTRPARKSERAIAHAAEAYVNWLWWGGALAIAAFSAWAVWAIQHQDPLVMIDTTAGIPV